jgi:hypothetical protein
MMQRTAALLAAVGLLALGLSGCSSGKPHAAGTPATAMRTFSAFTAGGDLSVTVADIATGSCWTSSIAAPGSASAFRCIAGNRIYDPCFAPPHPAKPLQVACLAAPWARAEVLRVPRLPRTTPIDGGRPWALVLRNGARCVAATGTVPQIRGVSLGYSCAGGTAAALLPGTAATRSADFGSITGNTLRRVSVTTIWRA